MIRFFIFSFKSRWFAFAATALVIGICVGALVAQKSVAKLAESQIHDLAHVLGKNMLILPAELDPAAYNRLEPAAVSMPEATAAQLMASPSGQHIRQMSVELIGYVPDGDTDQLVVGVKDLFPAQAGGALPILLSDVAAFRMGLTVGDKTTLHGRELILLRTVPSLRVGYEFAVITDLAAAQELLGQPGRITAIRAGGCWCSLDIPALALDVEGSLPGTAAYTKDGVRRAQKGSIREVARFSRILLVITVLLTLAAVALLMTSQLRRQTREIGLLMAIGGAPGAVTIGFISLAALTGLVGAGIGLLLSAPFGQLAGRMILGEVPPPVVGIPWHLLGGMTLVSILAASIPAFRASGTDPTSALREL